MSQNEIFLLVTGVSIIPSILLIRLVYKKSIIGVLLNWILPLIYSDIIIFYFIGIYGIKYLIYGFPLAFGIAIPILIVIRKLIKDPLVESIENVNEIAQGNLSIKITKLNSDSEIGILNNSLIQLSDSLKHIVTDIVTGSDNLASSSQQMSTTSQQISSGVSQQAAGAEEVSSSMEQMSANIQQNTENAIKTRNLSTKASSTMEEVVLASENSSKAVNDIYSKISVVVQIAEKTDLLAINAAVEAARAGDQGRGFAVVAAEVRKLAERSQLAANDIVALAERGMEMTTASRDQLNTILPDIQETSRLVEEIASASQEQDAGASQVNSAIQELSQVTQQNAASSEEMASNSEELASQAAELDKITTFFKLNDNTTSGLEAV